MGRYIKLFRGKLLISIIFNLLAGGVDVGFTLLLKGVIDRVSNEDIPVFVSFCMKSIIAVIFMACVIYLNSIIKSRLITNINYKIKSDLYKAIQKMNIVDYRKSNTGYFLSVINNDIGIIESDYFLIILGCFYDFSIFITAFIATISINFQLAIFLIILSLILMVIPFLFNKILSKNKKLYSDNMGIFTTKAKDILNAFEIVKAFNIKEKIFKEFNIYNKNVEESKFKFKETNAASSSVSTGVMYITYFLSLLISGYMAIEGFITIGAMIASVNLVGSIANPLMSISSNIATIKSTKLIRDKILDIIDYDSIEDETKTLIESFNEKIEFKDISFSYDGKNIALDNINLTLLKNKKYAIVGESGSGKSTLVKLLLHYYNDYSGKILIDDKDSKSIKEESLFKLMSIIQQDVFIFDDTIKNNITLFKEYKNEDIEKCLTKVDLTSMVSSLEGNIETNMGESGSKFSGGQKQRIALARAFIKGCSIIILDEATAALDNETAYRIEQSILCDNDLTLISITHKLIRENLKKYDEIIYVKSGKIAEMGSFDELMNKKGEFYSLYMVQN